MNIVQVNSFVTYAGMIFAIKLQIFIWKIVYILIILKLVKGMGLQFLNSKNLIIELSDHFLPQLLHDQFSAGGCGDHSRCLSLHLSVCHPNKGTVIVYCIIYHLEIFHPYTYYI